MIWEWIKGFFAIRHFFRAFVCKDYYISSYGSAMCARGARCDWRLCPKRKGGEE